LCQTIRCATFTTFFPLFEPPRSSKLTKSKFMATIPCSVSNHMFLMTTYRLKVVAKLFNYPVCHFLPLLGHCGNPNLQQTYLIKLSGSQMQALRRAYQDLRRTYSLPDGHVRHSDGTTRRYYRSAGLPDSPIGYQAPMRWPYQALGSL
jgi:hypothetical protein